MKPDELRSKLAGVIAFPITPFKQDLSLDLQGLRDNLDRLLAHRMSAVVAAGGTGEMYSMTPAEHLEVIRAMVERLTALSNLVAWKDGQGDIRRLQSIMHRVGDRLTWIGGAGDDMVAAYYGTGIRAFTSSIAAVAPRLSLRLHELAAGNRHDE